MTDKYAEGVKLDTGKSRIDLVPQELIIATGNVLGFGAAKYEERNWEKGMKWGRLYAALMRHMWAWWGGEKLDPESGMPHLHHAVTCLAMLIAYEARGTGTDDRYIAPLKVDPAKIPKFYSGDVPRTHDYPKDPLNLPEYKGFPWENIARRDYLKKK